MSITHPSQLPSVDRILQGRQFGELIEHFGRDTVTAEIRVHLDRLRKSLVINTDDEDHSDGAQNESSIIESLHTQITESLSVDFAPSLRKVFNLSGIVLHTNLGRAPYPQAAIDAMVQVSRGACNLEYNLSSGKRGRRDDHLEKWICKLTGAEAATTVNNNAAAVLLTLNTIAFKKNVIVSRGELIEIGGSFRIPAIMKKAGCKLREVGTTNRSHYKDYEEAIGKKTAALMKVHTSNYLINGFTHSVPARELTPLTKAGDIVLVDDLGSGALTDMTRFGLPYERTAQDAIADGADIITFSGDKLLGGPQCGFIAGREDLIRKIDKNPMKRAMRLDKVTIAALEAVLQLYCNPNQLIKDIPSLRQLSREASDIRVSAIALQQVLETAIPDFKITIEECQSQIGSGALPSNTLDSVAVVVAETTDVSADKLAQCFRSLSVPIIGRITRGSLWLDCRVVETDLKDMLAMLEAELPQALNTHS